MTRLRQSVRPLLCVALPLLAGGMVYIGWRPTNTIVLFDWMRHWGVPADIFRPSFDLPSVILYSFPDGCWVFAGTSWMLIVWQRLHPWVFAFLVLGVGSEFAQRSGLFAGHV